MEQVSKTSSSGWQVGSGQGRGRLTQRLRSAMVIQFSAMRASQLVAELISTHQEQ